MKNSLFRKMVKASITITLPKGFCKVNKQDATKGMLILAVVFLMFTVPAIAQRVTLTGGAQKAHPVSTGGSNNESRLEITNATGQDMWDVRLELKDGKMKDYRVSDKTGKLAGGNVVPQSAKVHIRFSRKVPNKGSCTLTFTSTSPNFDPGDSIKVVPTDSLGADLMVDRNLNPPVTTPPTASTPLKEAKPVPLTGGTTGVTIDPSNFPSLSCVNTTGIDVCDMRIGNGKAANGTKAKIDSVWVNNVKCTGTGFGTGNVHVFFPCISDGGTIKVTVKFNGSTEVVTYEMTPTNKDSINIGCPNIEFKKLTQIPAAGSGDASPIPIGKGSKITGGSPGGKVCVPGTNNTGQEIHDIIVQAFDKNKKRIPIKKVKVNGNNWPIGGTTNADSTVVHADKGNNPPIPNGGKFSVDIIAKSADAKIDSVHITPTDDNHNIIMVCSYNGNTRITLPDAYQGIDIAGRSISLVLINESCSPIPVIQFSSPEPGIMVEQATSSSPGSFDSVLQRYNFVPPVLPGNNIEINIRLTPLPVPDSLDPTPFIPLDFFGPGSDPFWGDLKLYNTTCGTGLNGGIDLSLGGGTGAYNILWSNGSTQEDISGLGTGTYTVIVTSGSSCLQMSGTISPSLDSFFDIFYGDIFCSGGNNGSIQIIESANAYDDCMPGIIRTYHIDGWPCSFLPGLSAGPHQVMRNEAGGCIQVTSANLNDPLPLMINGTINHVNCYGSFTGSIDVNVSGGNNEYYYLWNNGSTLEDRNNLKAGTHTVNVTDGFGCAGSVDFMVGQPAKITIGMPKLHILCGGSNTGKVTANPSGGVPPYTYLWSNGKTTKSNKNLFAGTYTVVVTDANGCTKSKSATIIENPPLMVLIIQTGPNTAMAQVVGGQPPYSISWNTIPPQTGPIATGLVEGQIYTCTVTDALGCVMSVNFVFGNMEKSALASLEIAVFPNPASDLLTVVNSQQQNFKVIRILNANGQLVYSFVPESGTFENHQIDVSNLAAGIYTLKAETSDKLYVKKIVINKN